MAKRGLSRSETLVEMQKLFPSVSFEPTSIRNISETHRISFSRQEKVKEVSDLQGQIEREEQRLHDRELQRELTQLQRTEVKRRQYIAAIEKGLSSYEPTPFIQLHKDDKRTAETGWILQFSDWHVGQLTPIETTGGIYEQTTEITKGQVAHILDVIKEIWDVQSKGQRISKLLVTLLGDIVEGDSMRASQARKIDMLVVQQVIEAFDLVCGALHTLVALPDIEEIEVDVVGGNHDRTSPKPGLAGLGELDYVDTYSWLIGAMLERAFAKEPRVKIKNWDTFYGYTKFMDHRIVFEHGSSQKLSSGSYGGVPWYPIINGAQKLMDSLGGADLALLGHIHRPGIVSVGQEGWLAVNGSLPATTQYVQSTMKAIRMPTQNLLTIDAELGMINWHPLYAPPPSLRKPGTIWLETV